MAPFSKLVVALIGAVLVGHAARASVATPTSADPDFFKTHVRPFFAAHCVKCHSGDKPKGDFRIDELPADFLTTANREEWRGVLEKIESSEMPPKAKPRPPADDIRALAMWISDRVHAAELIQRSTEGRVVYRRLNRVEYENTVHDLLGISVPLKDQLPRDNSANGFDNVGEALHTSSFLLDRYLDAADVALSAATANGPRPPEIHKHYLLTDTYQIKSTTEHVFRKLDNGGVVMFCSSHWQAAVLNTFYPVNRGAYRFRISVSAVQSEGKPVTFSVDAGCIYSEDKKPHLVGYFDAPAGKPRVVEFVDQIDPTGTIRILPYGLASAQTVGKVGADKWNRPGLQVDWVEVEGPLNDTWPPESHRRIFGDLSQGPAPTYNHSNRVEVVSKAPLADAHRILTAFAGRAFRRPVTDAEFKPILTLVEGRLAEKYSFEQAVRVGLTAILVSPKFLFLHEEPGTLDDYSLASRLSYFLWSTMPDEELLTVAAQGKLHDAQTLHAQVDRMLKDPKSKAFTENFLGQWLGLRDIDFTMPSEILYPEFDNMLKVSMLRETQLFFSEVIANDLSLTNFISSDFSMLNGRLARHYGIPGVEGWEFQKVQLPPGCHRGGLLTMASVLKVTANGTTTSPVLRGAWVLDRILGTPPPGPPENVAGLEPDTRGTTTIREQLAKHRQMPSCAGCHAKIDPPGFAMESFDVIGGWRENYRSSGSGKTIVVDGRTMIYRQGPPVDPSGVMPDGQTFRNIDEFKKLLLADKEQIARALTRKLVTYATGSPTDSVDQPQIDAIVASIREKNFGFRSLIQEVVASELFRKK